MKYKIIVDKQSRLNPSSDRREYEVDIEELRYKGDIADELIFTNAETYVMRRLSLSEYHVLSVLPEPVRQTIENVNIELFEGENFIYIFDMVGNKLRASYLVKNDFTDTYVTINLMNSAIEETAQRIALSVTQKLEGYATAEQVQALIEVLATQITIELSKKVNDEELTGASIAMRINEDTSEVKINADKLELTANDILNIIAGAILNLTAGNIGITSDNFKVDKNGKVECKDLTIKGRRAMLTTGHSIADFVISLLSDSSKMLYLMHDILGINNGNNRIEIGCQDEPVIDVYQSGGTGTTIRHTGVTTPKLTQTSLKSKKKNIKKLKANALELVKEADICEYNFKKEKPKAKKHIGLVIGEGYNCPEQVISEDGQGVEQYSLTSLLWKAVQELTDKVERLEGKLND